MDKFNTIKLVFNRHRKIFTVIIAVIVLVLSLVLVVTIQNKLKGDSIVYENLMPEKLEGNELAYQEENTSNEIYYVDIKGAVNHPGVYSINKGKRIIDALNKAGGVLENANTSLLNLSMEVKDGMVIIIYSSEELNNFSKLKEEEETKSEICQKDVYNDACICNSNTEVVDNAPKKEEDNNKTLKENAKVASEKVNINTASLAELMTLSKIGESKANAIIQYRNDNGNFKSIEEIKNVNGIGDSIFDTIKNNITI